MIKLQTPSGIVKIIKVRPQGRPRLLTPEQEREVYRRHLVGGERKSALAKEKKVSTDTIKLAIKRQMEAASPVGPAQTNKAA